MIVYCDFITAVLLHNLPYLSITRTKNQYKYYFYVQEILYYYYLKTMKIKCSDTCQNYAQNNFPKSELQRH